jgi:hypothetical protein
LSKLTIRTIPVLILLLVAGAKKASAQGVSAYFGMGSAIDSGATSPGCAPKQLFDPFTGANGTCETAPTMGGIFGVFGADFMIKPHLGVNGEYSFRFAQADYLPAASLKVRPAFYDFNAVFQPTSGDKRVVPVLEGGIGGAKLSFYVSQQAGSIFTQSQYFTSTNHFQVHAAVGVKLYVSTSVFLKPQVDLHYVPHLTDQYGRNAVPEFTMSIGYSFGRL